MEIGTFRGLVTALRMVLFIALVFRTYSRRRTKDFEAAARLPLDDDDRLPGVIGRGTEKD